MRAVLIAHLFYEDLLASSFSYLDHLPPEVDLVVTTAPRLVARVERLLAARGRRKLAVLPAGVRGRDAGALLVAAHPYLLSYDVLGFVHDKKTTGGTGDAAVGEAFRALLWENLLGDEEVVRRALSQLETEADLGLLVPPMPIAHEYFLLLGRPWSSARQATERVLRMLGLPGVPQAKETSQETRPSYEAGTGTAFWCRTQALARLFSHPFRYEDFPPEPLPLDGTLNHGLEHALPFIAQAAGYETRTLLSRRGAEVRCTLQERLLKRLCGFLAGRYYYATVEGLMQEMEGQTLMHFCERFPRRYIYGAGYHGRRLLPILAQMGFAAAGFLVSDGYDLPADLPLPVQHVSELARAADAGVIVAAAAGTRPAMMRALRALGWQEAQCYALR